MLHKFLYIKKDGKDKQTKRLKMKQKGESPAHFLLHFLNARKGKTGPKVIFEQSRTISSPVG